MLVVEMREVKKLIVDLACRFGCWWKLRIGAAARRTELDLASSGSFCAMRAGPWRMLRVNDIASMKTTVSSIRIMWLNVGDVTG